MSEVWKWWMSEDQERWFGPYASRELAIAAGIEMCDKDESFHICEAFKTEYTMLQVDGGDVLQLISEQYEDLGDPEGDGLFTDEITPAQFRELTREMSDVLHRWIERHKIEVGIFNFADSRNEEKIDREPSETV